RAEVRLCHVLEIDSGAARRACAQQDVSELPRVLELALRVDLVLELRAGRRRRLAELAGRDLLILLEDGVLDVRCGDAEVRQLPRIEPDADGIPALAEDRDRTHARQPLQRVDKLEISIVAD